jgi:hypothetical protein
MSRRNSRPGGRALLVPSEHERSDPIRRLEAVAATLNGRPRKTLGWRTPAEALDEHLRSLQTQTIASTG